jgi:hypothetical protein
LECSSLGKHRAHSPARPCSKLLGEEDEQIENKTTKKKLAESCENLVLSLRRIPGCGSVKDDDMQEWLNQDEE